MNVLRVGAGAVALVVALSGCAADERDGTPAPTTTSTAPATTTTSTTALTVDCPDGAPPVVTPIRSVPDGSGLLVSVTVSNMYNADIALDVGLKTELGVLVLDGPPVLTADETATYSAQTPSSAPEPTGVNVDVRWAETAILDVCPNP